MVKKTQIIPQPQNQPEAIVAAVQDMPEAEITSLTARQGKRVNALAAHNAAIKEAVQNKVQLIQQTENALTDVLTIAGDKSASADHEAKLIEASNKASFLLFRGRTTGIFSADEVSEMLGQTFGWKTKQNGEDSKTPFGQGESIRKRVVRAVDAFSFVNSNAEPKAFFEPLERAKVKQMLSEVETGNRSIYTLYNDLSAYKAEASGTRPKRAFDPKGIVSLTAMLSENVNASVESWHDTPGLFDAYAGLLRIINTVAEEYSVTYPEEIAA